MTNQTSKTAINPKRSENYSEWYQEVLKAADLAEHSVVRGCMVIKPWGYSIWELMQKVLDWKFKETGHQNAYFPLFIPLSFLQKEADHVEGFAKECAVVTHHRLEKDKDGNLVPAGALDEPLIVRPTSETIIGESFSKWITSYRDLPLLINQWCNVVRWEMRTRLFLRTTEFLWQVGHTAHANAEEALEETLRMLNIYEEFAKKTLAIPVFKGLKTDSERFPGAVATYCIEAMMQDRKALQMGTSHFLGQNFAKAFDVKYTSKEGKQEHVWASSWGVSTRLMGALIMAHSDDNGLVLPPRLAPIQIVIVPIYNKPEQLTLISDKIATLKKQLESKGLTVQFDDRDNYKPGYKFAEHEMKGIPVRIGIGPRDIENNTVEIARRDTLEKNVISIDEAVNYIVELLDEIQKNLYTKAYEFRQENTYTTDSYDEFKKILDEKGGFILAHWDGTPETETIIKEETKATIRCIPFDNPKEAGLCIRTGRPSTQRVLFARAY